ncbi:MAG: vitamin K epoxide reductase family protein [Nanoarchaeota archaeon]|nr:vitamin K epoxide reductase family protein [Nanoarchaeota archaeon]
MKFERYLTLFNIILVIGLFLSVFLVYEHFVATPSEYCNFGESFDCGIVNKSPYANIDGIFYLLVIDFGWPLPLVDISGLGGIFDILTSVAFLGFLSLLFVLLLNNRNINEDFLFVSKDKKDKWIKIILVFGVLFGGYLFLIQHFMLKTYCIFCIGLDAVLVSLTVIALMNKR